jgi:hypothetical protein
MIVTTWSEFAFVPIASKIAVQRIDSYLEVGIAINTLSQWSYLVFRSGLCKDNPHRDTETCLEAANASAHSPVVG